jgi:hypothetical protein
VPYGTDYAWRPSLVRRVLDWYEAQRPDRYVSWHDEVEWAGRGFKSGSWRLDVEAVVADFPRATDALDRELDARECEILEDWLRKDLAGDLFYRGHPGGTSKILPHERRAFLTAKEARDRLRFDADARK